jgi:hypothetical protein
MGIVFRRFGFVSLGLLVCAACGDASTDADANSGPPPFAGDTSALPAQPAMTPAPSANPDPGAAMDPPPSSPASNETPSTNLPVVPSTPATDGTGTAPPAQTPPEQTPPEQTPPEQTPPDTTPPAMDPPPEAPQTRVFLLFGQSNMYGLPAPQAVDLEINPRVEVLTLSACGRHSVDQWVPAQPPLHGCVGQPSGSVFGPGVGPGDYFARGIAAAFPEDTILLVPNAIPGVSIDVFQPGQPAYNSMLARARIAQQRGVISGIIFHQGETDCGSPQGRASWPGRVKTVVDRLRADLGVASAPFVAGELINLLGCSPDMNPVIDALPNTMTNTAIVSADGNFAAVQGDNYNNIHFDLAGQRELGRRYGEAMLGLLRP